MDDSFWIHKDGNHAVGYDTAGFAPVKAQAVRLVVKLRKGFSGGVLEWKLR